MTQALTSQQPAGGDLTPTALSYAAQAGLTRAAALAAGPVPGRPEHIRVWHSAAMDGWAWECIREDCQEWRTAQPTEEDAWKWGAVHATDWCWALPPEEREGPVRRASWKIEEGAQPDGSV